MRRLTLVLTVLLLAAIALACKEPPNPGLVSFAGDSVLIQAGYNSGDDRGADSVNKVGLGWQARHAQNRLTADVAGTTTSPGVSVQQFGQNYGGGFGPDQSAELMSLVNTPHEQTCVVIVLPHAGRTWEPAHHANIMRVRHDLGVIASARSHTIVVDWSVEVQANPWYLAADGVHLSPEDRNGDGRWDSSVAFMAMIWRGVERC